MDNHILLRQPIKIRLDFMHQNQGRSENQAMDCAAKKKKICPGGAPGGSVG